MKISSRPTSVAVKPDLTNTDVFRILNEYRTNQTFELMALTDRLNAECGLTTPQIRRLEYVTQEIQTTNFAMRALAGDSGVL